MNFTYTWTDAEQSQLVREDENGNYLFIPAVEGNRHYDEFLASGSTAADYVEPPAPVDSRTDAEKLEDVTGLTVDQIKSILGL